MLYEHDSKQAASIDVVAQVHNEVTNLLLERLKELRSAGEYDPSVVSNALKLVKDEDIRAVVEEHPLNKFNSPAFAELRETLQSDVYFQSPQHL